jgi:hypothetical protein
MIKNFPKSRLCAIDCTSLIEVGIRKTLDFTKKHNISLNSGDGKKILVTNCINQINDLYNKTKSIYPKVLCIPNNTNIKPIHKFVKPQIMYFLNKTSKPCCNVQSFKSPDLESAAEGAFNKIGKF